jgi:hypothetical protein
MTCPKCGGSEWKLASVIFAGGLSATSGFGAGVGVGDDIGLVVGGAGGISQTELSKLAAPPAKGKPPARIESPKEWKVVKGMWVALGLMVVVWYLNRHVSSVEYPLYTNMIFGGLPLGIILLGSILSFKARDPEIREKNRLARLAFEENHKLALIDYERTKMCLRCGARFLDGIDGLNGQSFAPPPIDSSAESPTTKKCPFCAETVLAEAILCKHCRSNLS